MATTNFKRLFVDEVYQRILATIQKDEDFHLASEGIAIFVNILEDSFQVSIKVRDTIAQKQFFVIDENLKDYLMMELC